MVAIVLPCTGRARALRVLVPGFSESPAFYTPRRMSTTVRCFFQLRQHILQRAPHTARADDDRHNAAPFSGGLLMVTMDAPCRRNARQQALQRPQSPSRSVAFTVSTSLLFFRVKKYSPYTL